MMFGPLPFPYSPVYGLYYVVNGAYVPVDLLDVRATAQIKDLAAQVTLSQRYHLPKSTPRATEATYSFPVPSRAAVSSFGLVKEDGSRVVGLVQEKEEARTTYDEAVQSGKLASLMVQDSPDVFTVSVGNILPGETVTVELSYATELAEDEENDSVRFTLPVNVGARYGVSPVAHSFSSVQTAKAFFTFEASIESVTPIAKIGCPSHSVETSLGPDPSLPNAASLPFSNYYARVAFASDKDLTTNFILTLKSAGLDSPRCVAEVHPTRGTAALALTMVPRFKLPDVARQEFIFLVDRSGSMGGSRMDTAKKALVVMLRSLPHASTLFNVLSFGGSTSALWSEGSKAYTQKTLDEATRHVDSMQANFGGTQICLALETVFKSLKTDRPTNVFVLTDGDAWELNAVLDSVKSAVSASPTGAYLRLFALGIGNSGSTAMVEGIARVGNGVSSSVADGESYTGKTARLLKAARSPLVSNITLDWGFETDSKESTLDDGFDLLSLADSDHSVQKVPISLFDTDVDPLASLDTPLPPTPPVILPPPAAVQQSPYTIRGLSPANRLYVYTILSAPAFTSPTSLPKSVTLRGQLCSGDEVEITVPVTLSHLPGSTAIHTLAARKLIQDLEDGQHGINSGDAGEDVQALVKASVVRLGTTYSLASTFTSFVAVDESEKDGSRKVESAPVVVLRQQSAPQPLFGGGGCSFAGFSYPAAPAPARPLFGAPPQAPQGGLFGTAPSGGLFGQSRNSTAFAASSPAGSLFSSRADSNLNGPPPPPPRSSSGFSFGASTPPPPAGSLFGQAQPSTHFGRDNLFGCQAFSAPTPPSSTPFGAAAPNPPGRLFGQPPQKQASSGLFGQSQGSASGGLFGFGQQQQASTTLAFGGFGTAGPSAAAQRPLFGSAQPAASNPLATFSFGAQTPAPSLFGRKPQSQAQQQQQSLFLSSQPGPASSLFGQAPPQASNFSLAAPAAPPTGLLFSKAAPLLDFDDQEPSTAFATPSPQPFPSSLSAADQLDALVRLQSFDGSFSPSVAILCGLSPPSVLALLPETVTGEKEVLAATLVAMKYFKAKLGADKDAWEGVWVKAEEFCVEALGDDFARVWAEVQGLRWA